MQSNATEPPVEPAVELLERITRGDQRPYVKRDITHSVAVGHLYQELDPRAFVTVLVQPEVPSGLVRHVQQRCSEVVQLKASLHTTASTR
jgi:hypothetical protein